MPTVNDQKTDARCLLMRPALLCPLCPQAVNVLECLRLKVVYLLYCQSRTEDKVFGAARRNI
jgi:hypothetical protein